MKLNQIKLSGFKSFVDSTLIEVHGQLVGIVGPNGCGKSNVIDAVRWALGESSARQLRGEAMTDVIFSGSLKRKPISRATVELTFDNSRKSLSGLWNNYNEIAIKRLISRQGDSSYYINNQQVRRKDIAELFLGTGVGSKGYAVIEQGMISRIIESKPEDMRLFIEEAAGVSKYRERRKETLHRLNDTQENLIRLQDIHSQSIKQLGSLTEQAKTAKLHQELTAALKHAQTLSLAIKITEANKNLQEANQFIAHGEGELEVLRQQLEKINLELTRQQELKFAKEQAAQELMQRFNDYRTSLARVEERHRHYNDLLKRFETESVDLTNKDQELEKDIIELTMQIESMTDKIEQNQFALNEQELICEEQQLAVDDKEQAHELITRAAANRQNELNGLKHELELCQNTLNHKRQQKTNLENRRARLNEETNILDFDQNYHQLKQEIELINDRIISYETQIQAKNIEIEELVLIDVARHKQAAQNQQQLAAVEAKIATLTSLIHQQRKTEDDVIFADSALIQELWQYLAVTPGYETALEASLGNLLQAKVIADFQQLRGEPQQQIAIWLAATEPVAPQKGTLSELVEIKDPKLTNLYQYLNSYILLNDVEDFKYDRQGLEHGKYYVTKAGHLLTRDYICYQANADVNHILQYRQQLGAEEEIYQKLELEVRQHDVELSQIKIRLEQAKADLINLNHQHKQFIAQKHDLQLEFTKQEQIFVQNQRHQERVTQESILLQQEISHLNAEVEELEIKLEDKNLVREELLLKSQDIELQKLESETSLQLARNKLQELADKANQIIIDNKLLNQQLSNLQSLIIEKRQQQQTARQKLADIQTERQNFNNNDQAQEISNLQQKIAEVATQMQQIQAEVDGFTTQIIGLKNQAASLNSSHQRNLEKINQNKFKQQEQQVLLTTYQENLGSLNLNELDIKDLFENNNLTLMELVEQAKRLETEIANLGLVNLKAIEDLELLKAKEQELTQQLDDLQQAAMTLQSAIEHIDNETRKLLQNTFDKLNSGLEAYFRILFGGGNARLALTEKDILNAGVQIFAEPPGKKNSTIYLLSGGEKALTAMSFIFALFSLNPAPFCLLDEVDAPLDDANTQRFCELVKQLADKTQFVYISHNRLAMEMADQLVGVTMQEKGVSTVVSVNLVEAVKHAAESAN